MSEQIQFMATLSGHVRLHKSIRRNPVWKREPFTYGQAFCDLVMLAVDAQSAPQSVWVQGEQIVLERGQVGWSIAGLAKEWQRTREWVSGFLKWAHNKGMLTVDSNHRRTIITLTNYDTYQPTEPSTDLATEPSTDLAHKGKGERGNGKGVTGNDNPPPREPHFPEMPDDDALAAWFAGLKDLSRGIDGIPEIWWRGWVSSRLNARKWPQDWQQAARMAFLADFAEGHPKALAGLPAKNKKNGRAPGHFPKKNGGSPDGRTAAQARFELSRELEEVQARLDACHEIGAEPSVADGAREKELQKELRILTAENA